LRDDIRRVETNVTRVETNLARVETNLREEIVETRRHAKVLYESLRDDIRMVAEAVVAIDAKVTALKPPSVG